MGSPLIWDNMFDVLWCLHSSFLNHCDSKASFLKFHRLPHFLHLPGYPAIKACGWLEITSVNSPAENTSSRSKETGHLSSNNLIVRSILFSLGFLKFCKLLILGFQRPWIEAGPARDDQRCRQSRWDHLKEDCAPGGVRNSCLYNPSTPPHSREASCELNWKSPKKYTVMLMQTAPN